MNACEYLSQVGFESLLETATPPTDEEDQQSVEIVRLVDHDRVRSILIASDVRVLDQGRHGAFWVKPITWPDRVPGLKTWAGKQTLPKIITKLQAATRMCPSGTDLFEFRFPLKGTTGLDLLTCQDAIDIGFSPNALGMEVVQRPAMELLAILGLETVPIISFASRTCGFVHDGKLWKFQVHKRAEGYYHRWGVVEEVDRNQFVWHS